jgi:hypothetical protein
MADALTAATTAIAAQQALLLTGLGAVIAGGVVVAFVKWGVPQAIKLFKRVAS